MLLLSSQLIIAIFREFRYTCFEHFVTLTVFGLVGFYLFQDLNRSIVAKIRFLCVKCVWSDRFKVMSHKITNFGEAMTNECIFCILL